MKEQLQKFKEKRFEWTLWALYCFLWGKKGQHASLPPPLPLRDLAAETDLRKHNDRYQNNAIQLSR